MKLLLVFIAKLLSNRRYTLVVFDRRKSVRTEFGLAGIETEQGTLFDLLS